MQSPPDKKSLVPYLAAALAVAAGAAFVGQGLWDLQAAELAAESGGPVLARLAPLAWAGIPAAAFLPSLCLCLLLLLAPAGWRQGEEAGPWAARILAADATCYLFLPVAALLPVLIPKLGNGPAAVSLCFLAFFLAKAAILLWVLWRLFLAPAAPGSGWAVFGCLAVVLGLAGAWVSAHPAGVFEQPYLAAARAVAGGGGGGGAPDSLALPWLLAGPWYLGGRLACLLVSALFCAALAGVCALGLKRAGVEPLPLSLSLLLLVFSWPVLGNGLSVSPAPAGMAASAGCLLFLQAIPKRPRGGFLGVILCGLGLYLATDRYLVLALAFLGLGLFLFLAHYLSRLTAGLATASSFLLLAGGVAALPPEALPARVNQGFALLRQNWALAANPLEPFFTFAAGLGLDVNAGIFFAGPGLLLAAAGVAGWWKQDRKGILAVALAGGGFVFAGSLLHWPGFMGPPGPPGYLAAPLLPALALPLALGVAALASPGRRLALVLLGGPSVLAAAFCLLSPELFLNRVPGLSGLISRVFGWLGFYSGHLFPSLLAPGPVLVVWVLAFAAAAAGLFILGLAGPAKQVPGLWQPPGGRETALGAGAALCALALFLALAAWLPATRLPAAQLSFKDGRIWQSPQGPLKGVGVLLAEGGELAASPRLPAGKSRLAVFASSPRRGSLEFYLDGRLAGAVEVAGPGPFFLNADRPAPGRCPVALRWLGCPGRDCPLLVDRLELRRAP